MRIMRALGLIVVAASLAASPLLAQEWRGKARIDGFVKDKDGHPIADATVELTKGPGKATTKTNNKGYWAILGLAGGQWNIDISAAGFDTRRIQRTGSRVLPRRKRSASSLLFLTRLLLAAA